MSGRRKLLTLLLAVVVSWGVVIYFGWGLVGCVVSVLHG